MAPVDLVPDNAEAVQALLRRKGWIEPSVSITELESAGEGNMNRTLRATLSPSSPDGDGAGTVETKTLILKQSVPYVAKYPQIAAPEGRLDVEAAFYLAAASSEGAREFMPNMLHYDEAERLLCLEDLGGGGDMTPAYLDIGGGEERRKVLTAEHRESLMRWLAALHAIKVDQASSSTFANVDMRVLNHEHIFDLPLTPDNGLDLDGFTAGLQAAAEVYTGDGALRSRAAALGNLYLGRGDDDDDGRHRRCDVLLHGDFYPGSFLSNDQTGVKVIDPEFGFLGPAEFDLGVFIAHCCFCRVDLNGVKEALDAYSGGTTTFDRDLAFAFAGMELIRRLLGVAQLPLSPDTTLADKKAWLSQGRDWIMAWSPDGNIPAEPSATISDAYDFELGYHPSIPPLDVRLGITPGGKRPVSPPPDGPLRWGILSCGKAAHDFAQALKRLEPHHVISAVATRSDADRAKSFASLHSIPTSYGSYEVLCTNPAVDIVYVATLHPQHREAAELALNAGKHVLVEKPMAMTAKDAEAIYKLGKERNLFVGEGMWTRFFPAVEWTRRELERRSSSIAGGDEEEDSVIGPCRVVRSDFCIEGDDVGPYPSDSIYSAELGGGAALIMGSYVVGAAMLPFSRPPDQTAATGILPDDNGVGELAAGATLTFHGGSDDGGTGNRRDTAAIAATLVGFLAESGELTEYAGKGGQIVLNSPAHCPTSVTARIKDKRGNAATETTRSFPLPPTTPSIDGSGGIRMPNSMGFIYEAEAVRRLIAAGKRTFPQWTPEESVGCLRTIGIIREQVGKR